MKKAKRVVVLDYNVAVVGSAHAGLRNFFLGSYSEYNIISVQVEWKNLTGTLNSSVKIQQKAAEMALFADIPTLNFVLDSADGTKVLEGTEWGSEDLNLVFNLNNCTGGTLSIVVIAKSK